MTLFIAIHVFVCIFLVGVILLQPGKSDGGGIGFGSSSQSIFGSKGAGNFLTKTTSVCAVLFLVTSFILTRSRIKEYTGSVIKANAASKTEAPAAAGTPAPAATEAAKAGEAPKAAAPANTSEKK